MQSKFQILNKTIGIPLIRDAVVLDAVENWLECERDQLPFLFRVGIGTGIIMWQSFGIQILPILLLFLALFIAAGLAIGLKNRFSIVLIVAALTIGTGYAALQIKSNLVAGTILEKIRISEFYGRIVSVEVLTAHGNIRLDLETGSHDGLPHKIRVNLKKEQYRPSFIPGATIRLRARLMPSAGPMLPGGYDFAKRACFARLGASGSALGEISLHEPANHDFFCVTHPFEQPYKVRNAWSERINWRRAC